MPIAFHGSKFAVRRGWPSYILCGTCAAAVGLWIAATFQPEGVQASLPPAGAPTIGKPRLAKPAHIAVVASADKLDNLFGRIGYDLDSVRTATRTVPRLVLASVPNDLGDIAETDVRKHVFLRLMLPLVLEANERVQRQRMFLLGVKERVASDQSLAAGENRRLKAIAAEYDVEPDKVTELLRRVDVVPVSLALAQAAIESAWGTSRFVQEGNATFGQWTTEEYKGIVPLERPEGETYKIRAYDRVIDSVHSYMRNLNTHQAYGGFRDARAKMRAAGKPLDGFVLAETLTSYAETGDEYVALLHHIIKANDLELLNDAQLGDEVVSVRSSLY